MTGTVKFFIDTKGFGFIRAEGVEEDIFVHFSSIVAEGHRTLTDGQKVEFDLEKDGKTGKLRAVNVVAK